MKVKSLLNHPMFADSFGMAVGQVFIIGISFLISVVLARNLKVEDLGYYLLVNAYAGTAGFFSLPGMQIALTKGILKNYDNIYKPVLLRILIASFIGAAILIVLGNSFFLSNKEISGKSIFFWAAIVLFFTSFDCFDTILQAKREFVLSRKYAVFSSFLSLCFIAYATYSFKSLKAALFATVIAKAITSLGGWLITTKKLSLVEKDSCFEAGLIRHGWEQSLVQVVNPIVSQLDRVVIGGISPSMLAIYHVGSMIPRKIKDNIKLIFSVPLMHWGALNKSENLVKIQRHWRQIFNKGFQLSLLVCIISPLLIPLLYGPEYSNSVLIACLLSLTIGVRLISNIFWAVDLYQDTGRSYAKNIYITKGIYVILLLCLAPMIEIYGIVISFLVFDLVQFFLGYKYFKREIQLL